MIDYKNNNYYIKQNYFNKIVCYTCITNNYDNIINIQNNKANNITYICFVDNVDIYQQKYSTYGWLFKQIPLELNKYSKILQQRLLKICAHEYLKQYDISIWIDSNIEIINFKDFFNNIQILLKDNIFIPLQHQYRNTLNEEVNAVINQGKATQHDVLLQYNSYIKNGYNDNNGLFETGILVRFHNTIQCKQIEEEWKKQLLQYTYRDQLSLGYSLYKVNYNIKQTISLELRKKYIKIHKHNYENLIQIAICNYNTNKLTNNCIKSILKYCQFKYILYIFDNSDKEIFKLNNDINIPYYYIDNTQQKVINFDNLISSFSQKYKVNSKNNFASLKHAYSIHYLISTSRYDNLLLLDSDTEIIHTIDFINKNYATISDIEFENNNIIRLNNNTYPGKTRFCPFIQYFNLKMLREKSIKYFNCKYMHGIYSDYNGNTYDTGAYFYKQIIENNLPFSRILHNKYIKHLNHGSWKK